MVNGPDPIFVERAGRVEQLPLRFASHEQLMQTIERIVSTVNRRVDESNPMVDARLPTGERVNVIIPPLVPDRRRPSPSAASRAPTPCPELIGLGSLDEQMLLLLSAFVRARFNVIVSGGTGSGKTTLLNALSGLIPDDERIITIEDSAELQLQQDACRSASNPGPPNVEGKGQITIRDLVRNSLRMRPDRIIVGEVRGGETLDMLQAMSTGHDGSLATVHANSRRGRPDAPADPRLDVRGRRSPSRRSRTRSTRAVDVIVQLTRHADGSRKVTEIALLVSHGREQFRIVDGLPLRAAARWAPTASSTAASSTCRCRAASPSASTSRNEPIPPAFGVADGLDVRNTREAIG